MQRIINKILGFLPNKNGQQAMRELLNQLNSGGINFKITNHQDESGSYIQAEAEVDGRFIITSGRNLLELDRNIKDAIFTAYRVPSYYCDEKLINSPLVKQKTEFVYVTR